jgi:hypothetical protein
VRLAERRVSIFGFGRIALPLGVYPCGFIRAGLSVRVYPCGRERDPDFAVGRLGAEGLG